MKTNLLVFIVLLGLVIPLSYAQMYLPADNIPPTNAFDKIHTDNGTINSVNFSMPLNIKSGSGISVKSNNSTHTVTISNTASSTTQGTLNTTQANNANVNTGGYKLNFINGTGCTVNVKDSHSSTQTNVTISCSGSGGTITSINGQIGPTISINRGSVTNMSQITNSSNIISYILKNNIVQTNGSTQSITKQINFSSQDYFFRSPTPNTNFQATSATTDNQIWRIRVNTAGTFLLQTVNNAISIASSALTITRSGTTISLISLGSDASIPSTNKLFYDGGGDTYTLEASANDLQTFVGGSKRLDMTATTESFGGGTNIVYRCATAGALPVGALTINATSCGTTTDTTLRVP